MSFPHRARQAAALSVLLLLSAFVPPAVPAPSLSDGLGGDSFFEAQATARREAALDAYTREIEAGVNDLRLHYIKGGAEPLPRAMPIEFLLFRASSTGRQDLKDLALATVAVYTSLHLNDYLAPEKRSTAGGAQPAIKRSNEESEILAMTTAAWRASGKEIFKREALKTGNDLTGWAVKPNSNRVASEIEIPPAVVALWSGLEGGRKAQFAATLLEAGLVFDQATWRDAGRSLEMKSSLSGEATPAARLEAATLLLAFMDAASLGAHRSWNPQLMANAAATLKRTPSDSPPDPISTSWTALALMRYGRFAHDDSATAAARALLDGLTPPDSLATDRDPELFAAQAAAAYALQLDLNPVPMAYIVGKPGTPETEALVIAALKADRPGRLVAVHSPDEEDLLYPADSDGVPIVYVCSGELCAPPTDVPAELTELLETFALPEGVTAPGSGPPPE
jgi:hypothetical protein